MERIKVFLLGDTYIGKTSIIREYFDNKLSIDDRITTSPEKFTKEIELDDQTKIIIEVWDSAGVDNFRVANKIFLKKTKIALLVYNITNKETFDQLNEFYEQINEINGKGNIFFAVVGNKSDLYEKREVTFDMGKQYSDNINSLFYEVSAMDNKCIHNLFNEVLYHYLIYKKQLKKCSKIYKNGDSYDGELDENEIKNGYGIMKYKNKNIYVGNWYNDKKNFKGIMKYNNGDIYEGYWNNDLKEGKGKMKYNNKDIYEGNWEKDNFIKGKIIYNNKDIYEGDINKNKKEGNGKMIYNNGDIYEGDWKKDLKEGKGKYIFNNNRIINNDYILFKENNMKEIFNLNIINYIFKGNVIKDKINGEGILYKKYNENILNNNTIFIGEFEKNIKKGKGILHFTNGSYFKGYWKDDNNIDENEKGEFYLNELKKICKICKTEDWIKIIKNYIFFYYGNNQINIPFSSNIK